MSWGFFKEFLWFCVLLRVMKYESVVKVLGDFPFLIELEKTHTARAKLLVKLLVSL